MSGGSNSSLTGIAFCWTLERRDGAGLAMTSHDRAISLGGRVHEPNPGLMPSAIVKGEWDEPSGEVSGAVTSDALSETDLLAGRWSGALSRLSATDWSNVDAGSIELVSGELGEIAIEGSAFRADLLGAGARLSASVCPTTSPECRASLGDKQCRVNMAGRTMRATVLAISGNELMINQPVDERFAKGRLHWLSGNNTGLKSLVSGYSGATLLLREPPRLTVRPGDCVQLFEGCDKRLETCRTRFRNVANFRGEPHLPGNDLLTRYPGA
jgi:uncharacterized phage protein (TIGR02218 family)